MNKSYTKLALLLLLVLSMTLPSSLLGGVDETEMQEKLPALLGQDNMGRDFWFSIPPVYEQVAGDNFVRVLVTSDVETDVIVQVDDKGVYQKKTTIANGVIDFELRPSDAQPITHSYSVHKSPQARIYPGIGVNVSADAPIVVYVVVKYKYTSDGFLALPVSGLGDRYVNMVYQDPALGGNGSAPAFTCVIGAYDNTEITMTMGGGPEGVDVMRLEGGREITAGEKTSFRLERGDVWMGASNGNFMDISGSLFEGTKPFAIVSGMHCANFPVGNPWCDYTVEMELPTYAWGKQYYVTPMVNREFNGIVRVYASEPNTTVYKNGQIMGKLTHGGGNTLGKAYMEFRLWPKLDDFGQPNPPQIATIHADKPIAVMYYNTGTAEDGGGDHSDPFQLFITPIEQFQTEILFPSPNATGGQDQYVFNYVNVIFEMKEDFVPRDLLFAEMKNGRDPDWKLLADVVSGAPRIFTEEYKGSKYGTVTINLPSEGVFSIKSDSTKFVAYSYGFSDFESYGFPTSAALRDLASPDVDAPVPTYVQECDGDVLKDMGNVTDMPEDDEIRSNIADLYLIENLNDNYLFDYRIPGENGKNFIPGEQRTLSWWLTVVDKTQPARATIVFMDRAGNDTTITVSYFPPDFEVASGNAFGAMSAADAPVVMQDTIRNLSDTEPQYITKVELQDGSQGFSIVGFEPAGWTPPMAIAPGEEVIVNVEFDPAVAAASGEKELYKDSLGVGYGDDEFEECGFAYYTEQTGSLGEPKIVVGDWPFGSRNINIAAPDVKTIQIRNTGDQPLEIYGISQDLPAGSMFTHNFMDLNPTISAANPLVILPGEIEQFDATFKPTAVGAFADNIVFDNNTANNGTSTDNVCELTGEGTDAPVFVGGHIWDGHLINRPAPLDEGPYTVYPSSTHPGFIIGNLSDTETAKVENIRPINLSSPNVADYFITSNGDNIATYLENSVKGMIIQPGQSPDMAVVFNPTAKGNHSIQFEFTFSDNTGGIIDTITYAGIGLVPNIRVENVHYDQPMLVDDEAAAQTDKFMVITNIDDEFGYELDITGISFVPNNNEVSADIADFQGKTFRYDDTMIQDLLNGTTILQPGDDIQVPVHFVARQVGVNEVTAVIESNADVDGTEYDNDSKWDGIGTSLSMNVTSADADICILTDATMTVYLEHTVGDDDIVINNISLLEKDLNGDGVDDIRISSPTTDVNVPVGGRTAVTMIYTPSGVMTDAVTGLDLSDHNYGANLAISGTPSTVITLSSFTNSGSTETIITNSSVDRNPTVEGFEDYDTEFMLSIGDDFDYEIDFSLNGSNVDAQSVTVNINYNKLFAFPLPNGADPYTAITTDIPNARIKAESFSNEPAATGPAGSMVLSFVLETQDGNTIFNSNGIMARVPFTVVLPSVDENGQVTELAGSNTFGRFDVSHTITDLPACYTHEEDLALIAVEEICIGELRTIYISGLPFTEPTVTPNPASSEATIEYTVPYDQPGEIAIYNSSMKQVGTLYSGEMKEGVNTVDVPVSELSNGVYYFKVTIGEQQQLGRVIIAK